MSVAGLDMDHLGYVQRAVRAGEPVPDAVRVSVGLQPAEVARASVEKQVQRDHQRGLDRAAWTRVHAEAPIRETLGEAAARRHAVVLIWPNAAPGDRYGRAGVPVKGRGHSFNMGSFELRGRPETPVGAYPGRGELLRALRVAYGGNLNDALPESEIRSTVMELDR